MKTRFVFAALAITLAGGAAHAQYASTQPYCREFTKVVTIGGQAQSAYGQACRQPDGSWQIVSDDIPPNQPVEYYPQDNYVAYQPVQPLYAPPIYQPIYYSQPSTFFSLSYNSWNPHRTRYYNDHGHGWRDSGRGGRDRGDWNHGGGHRGHGDGNGNGRH